MRSITSYLNSVRWRFTALRDPAAFAASETAIEGARDADVRDDLLEEARRLGLRDRLRLIWPVHDTRPIEEELLPAPAALGR